MMIRNKINCLSLMSVIIQSIKLKKGGIDEY